MHAEFSSLHGAGCLRVTGLPAGAAAALVAADPATVGRRVIVAPTEVVERVRDGRGGVLALEGSLPPVAGHFAADGDALCFVSRFPFLPGTDYSVLVHGSLVQALVERGGPTREPESSELDDYLVLTTRVPRAPSVATTRVVQIFPTATELPRNQLKLYVEFSAPMSEGEVARHVHLRRAGTGAAIDAAFLALEPELWDRDRRRVTILFDPARIKRGLVPNQVIGYPLTEGTAVEVVVDAGFLDGDGRPLAADATRHYAIGPDVRRRVDPDEWHLAVPAAGTRAPLMVTFDRPLDRALLGHCLAVTTGDCRTLAGNSTVSVGETAWSFTPGAAWRAGTYELVVDGILEDLAGNSVQRVFDRELERADHTPPPGDRFTRTFGVA